MNLGHMGFAEYGSGLSAIDEVMQRERFTIDDLLEVEEIIQEAKFCNSQLLDLSDEHTGTRHAEQDKRPRHTIRCARSPSLHCPLCVQPIE
jgi:hypothetical protein